MTSVFQGLCLSRSMGQVGENPGNEVGPQFYPGVYVALVTLLTYPVSTCAAERGFSGMKRLKTPLRSTMSEERLSSLAIHFDFPHTQAQEC